MPSPIRLSLILSAFIVLPGLSFSASAQWVQHCQGPNGEITYTASNCPPEHTLVAQQPPRRISTSPPPRSPVKIAPKAARLPSKAHGSGTQTSQRPAPAKKAVEKKPVVKKQKEKAKRKKTQPKYLPNR